MIFTKEYIQNITISVSVAKNHKLLLRLFIGRISIVLNAGKKKIKERIIIHGKAIEKNMS